LTTNSRYQRFYVPGECGDLNLRGIQLVRATCATGRRRTLAGVCHWLGVWHWPSCATGSASANGITRRLPLADVCHWLRQCEPDHAHTALATQCHTTDPMALNL
jgi:hypothetical protein